MRLVPVMCVLVSLASIPVSLAARQDHHGASDQRGAMVMGFDQNRTDAPLLALHRRWRDRRERQGSRRHKEP